ncbi:MAG: lysophospholipid acyltransferase family protein [Oscillospiraceae bacterium]|nr:lysophospholipid acyltransferase family protein [Oscillospiraceae bacterium]
MIYRICYVLARIALALWHPVFRVSGRENIPQDRNVLICPNHSGFADPIWVVFALRPKRCPKIMAKANLLKIPLLGALLKHIGVFGVRRGENDMAAVKTGLKVLREGENLLLFPEGTRVRPWKTITPKSGAILFSVRTGTPILPVWLEPKRFPFSPLHCVVGEPYLPQIKAEKPSTEELHTMAADLIARIYALEERK